MDRRVQKTQDQLRHALIALMIERGYEKVTVQHILDRANVGRSTFYVHFRDKEALLHSSLGHLRGWLEQLQKASVAKGTSLDDALAFVLPWFEHGRDQLALWEAIAGRHSGAIVMRELQRMFVDLTRADLGARVPRPMRQSVAFDLLVEHVVGALFAVMTWWVDRKAQIPPAELNQRFRQLTMPGVIAVLRPR